MFKLPQFRFGSKLPKFERIKKLRENKVFAKNLLFKKSFLAVLALLFVVSAIFGAVYYKNILPSSFEPNVTISTEETVADKAASKMDSPALQKEPDLSETTTLPKKEADIESKQEAKNTEQEVNKAVNTMDNEPVSETKKMEHPVNFPPSRKYGFTYSKTYKDYRFHKGVDFKADSGTPVRAVMAGKIDSVEYSAQEAYKIVVNHGSGWKTVYSHVGDVKVEKGQRVGPGDTLAVVAVPGSKESIMGPHLHFELLYKGQSQNPLEYLPEIETH